MEQLVPLLQKAADTVGVTVTHVWPLLVAITFWTSLFWAILDPVIVVVYMGGVVWFWRHFYGPCRQLAIDLEVNYELAHLRTKEEIKEAKSIRVGNGFDSLVFGVIGAVWAIIGIFFAASAVETYPLILAGVANPEGVTVLNLLQQLKVTK